MNIRQASGLFGDTCRPKLHGIEVNREYELFLYIALEKDNMSARTSPTSAHSSPAKAGVFWSQPSFARFSTRIKKG